MNLRLSDLSACFEGVIPSIIATASADGMPNISYLSHVVRVDEEHVALSNQFFAKTAANVRANPKVTLILVDGFTGDQFLLDVGFVRSVDAGALFDKIARQLKASSAQIGMSDVMRLRSADIFRVYGIEKVPSPVETASPPSSRAPVSLPDLSKAIKSIERQSEADEIIDSLLVGVKQVLGCGNALVLIHDSHRGCLITMGSIGYERSGLGSEIAGGDGLIGAAAAGGQAIKVSDMSRVRRFGEAIGLEAEGAENTTRTIAFPHLPTAMSQIAVPMIAGGAVTGVLFIESTERLAFREEDEAALEILAGQAAGALRASERAAAAAEQRPATSTPEPVAAGREIRVVHHRFDDSVFIDGTYIVKGVAGTLLRLMLDWHLSDGRSEFTNREMRLTAGARMPEIKDNLETRLLLLRRRLEEKQAPIRLARVGRGRVRLEAEGPLVLEAVTGEYP
ncbi:MULTISPECIES: pyridoxamine 5'-phosphate oxidase family protein [Rhizobium]|uniref:pyridoxamine 5'-phosphate oxidase family protein n=1 Tax=Rhizobium TaxID=379 RepID=UPI0007E9E7A8|nr:MULTISPECIES: GAF domain-containing protein [Rhizobium]ANK90148.1 pyridoxamine 5'-phosphate oxidase-like protein [Rhizobium sp. N6212]ANK96175.1 pyridoxamine 5'-phosphate oxidase-like protein [Rhizobium sp. N621]ANL02219.1 pyridoxamine 5'-phosphate oxidase-like protein [Rhizobium esperanzae]ANL08347.1 pyridoxamine 5'-phosphate oxidase-like protein [Rhizobium sp. N1341]ANL20396.1 pyridoxamine 5'-phosphate oxidase-like protein [Rhizobium sp. N113]